MTAAALIDPGLQRRLARNVWTFPIYRAMTDFFLLAPIWVVFLQEERGLSIAQVAGMEGPFWLAIVLVEVPTGMIADRFGRKTSLVLGALASAVGVFIFAMATSYAVLFGSYMLWAMGLALLSGADSAFYYDTLKALGRENEYQRLWGRVWASMAGALGAAIFLGPLLAAVTTLQIAILVNAGVFFLAFLLSLTFVEPPRDTGGVPPGFLQTGREAVSILRSRAPVRAIMMFGAVLVAAVFAADVYIQPFLRGNDVAVGFFGPLLLPGRVLGMVAAIFAYRIAARLGFRRITLVLLGALLAPLSLLAAWDSIFAFALFPLLGAVTGLMQPVVSDYINRRIPSAQRATVLSFYSLMFSGTIAVLVPTTGLIGELGGIQMAFLGVAAFVAGAGIPLAMIFWRADRREPAPPAPTVEVLGDASR
jgi:predicted MFS family arabinose efflux permease